MNIYNKASSAFIRNFGGLCPRLSRYDSSRFVVLVIPYEHHATCCQGISGGPSAIIDASIGMELYDAEFRRETCQDGICTLVPFDTATLLTDPVTALRQEIARHQSAGKFVISLGGERTITLGLVEGSLKKYPGLSVLRLAAHPALCDVQNGPTLDRHTVMRRVAEKVPVVQAGIRSLGADESAFINEHRLPTFFARDMIDSPQRINELIGALSDEVYLSIDVSVFDPSVVPDAAQPEPGGLSWYPVLDLLRELFAHRRVLAMDLVELCPVRGDVASARLAAKLAYLCAGYASHGL